MSGPGMSGPSDPNSGKCSAGVGGATPRASHSRRAHLDGARPETKRKADKVQVKIRRCDSGQVLILKGRNAQTLLFLHVRGVTGATSGDFSKLGWGRRTSAYVFNLRRTGFDIETRFENIGDARVGRYTLHSVLEFLPVGEDLSC
jgi:hypothetical protein